MDLLKFALETNATLNFQSQSVVVVKGEVSFPFTAIPVSFNQDVIDEKSNFEGEKQSFIFIKTDLLKDIGAIVPGLKIVWDTKTYVVIRGKGSYYDDDQYGIRVVVQCIKQN